MNIATTRPTVLMAPNTMPGPRVGTHDARSMRRSCRATGAACRVLVIAILQCRQFGQLVVPGRDRDETSAGDEGGG